MSEDDLPVPVPRSRPNAVIAEKDVWELFRGLQPGWYTTADVYPRYLAWAEREGHPPASAKTLGESIRRGLRPQRRHVRGHVSVWEILPEHVTGAPVRRKGWPVGHPAHEA